MKIVMQHIKSTKGTHVYGDKSEDSPIPSLYIKRNALPKIAPDSITVEVTFNEE